MRCPEKWVAVKRGVRHPVSIGAVKGCRSEWKIIRRFPSSDFSFSEEPALLTGPRHSRATNTLLHIVHMPARKSSARKKILPSVRDSPTITRSLVFIGQLTDQGKGKPAPFETRRADREWPLDRYRTDAERRDSFTLRAKHFAMFPRLPQVVVKKKPKMFVFFGRPASAPCEIFITDVRERHGGA